MSESYMCLEKHQVYTSYLTPNSLLTAHTVTYRRKVARETVTQGVKCVCFNAFKQQPEAWNEDAFVSLKKKKEEECNLKSTSSLTAQKHWPQGHSTFQRPTYPHNNNANLWKCRLRVENEDLLSLHLRMMCCYPDTHTSTAAAYMEMVWGAVGTGGSTPRSPTRKKWGRLNSRSKPYILDLLDWSMIIYFIQMCYSLWKVVSRSFLMKIN